MGTYLSTPVLDKTQDFGESKHCSWGLTEMQGWRSNMEDAGLARSFEEDTTIFGVFDGHGGMEVSAFTAMYFCSILKLQTGASPGERLIKAFHATDVYLTERISEVQALKAHPPVLGEQRHIEDEPITYDDDPKDEVTTDGGDSSQAIVVVNQQQKVSFNKEKDDDSVTTQTGKTVDLDDDIPEDDDDDDAEVRTEDFDEDERTPQTPSDAQIQGIIQRMMNQRPPPESRSVELPSIIHNGQVVCNLPSHSLNAGTTSIVAWLMEDGKRLVVANAGDSRGVLCRNGSAIALSEDHKPSLPVETARIEKAGGFVNALGRVNGNLNLSRGIGDLKYKQNPNLTAAQQMITAEPDIKDMKLNGSDEFFMLGCDGIWDCLSNQEAVDFVRSRINNQSPADIGAAMLDHIVGKEHPKNTQGMGGDNMTILIVDLKPNQRSYTTTTMIEV